MRKICTFIGGSNIKVDSFLKDKISKVLKNIIYDDCRHFYCGCFGNFSLLCATVIREMQKQSYNVSLTCFVPILENANYYVSQLESTDLYDDIHILEDYSLKDLDLYTSNFFGAFNCVKVRNVAAEADTNGTVTVASESALHGEALKTTLGDGWTYTAGQLPTPKTVA